MPRSASTSKRRRSTFTAAQKHQIGEVVRMAVTACANQFTAGMAELETRLRTELVELRQTTQRELQEIKASPFSQNYRAWTEKRQALIAGTPGVPLFND